MQLSSPAVDAAGYAPARFTCESKNASPPLMWSGQPVRTQSFVITAEDTSVSENPVRWIVANIPPSVFNLPKGLPAIQALANSEVHGINDLGKLGYEAPCPAPGQTQEYLFTIWALDEYLPIAPGSTLQTIAEIIEGHVLARGSLKIKFRRESAGEKA